LNAKLFGFFLLIEAYVVLSEVQLENNVSFPDGWVFFSCMVINLGLPCICDLVCRGKKKSYSKWSSKTFFLFVGGIVVLSI
jgi:hypothetical protein